MAAEQPGAEVHSSIRGSTFALLSSLCVHLIRWSTQLFIETLHLLLHESILLPQHETINRNIKLETLMDWQYYTLYKSETQQIRNLDAKNTIPSL